MLYKGIRYSFTMLFLLFIFGTSFYVNNNYYKINEEVLMDTQMLKNPRVLLSNLKSYESILSNNSSFVNIFGLSQKLMQKKEVKNFEVICDDSDNLYIGKKSAYNPDYEKAADNIQSLNDFCTKANIPFLYAQMPYKSSELVKELEYYGVDTTESGQDSLIEKLEASNTQVLDLRKYEDTKKYFKTDHHWTSEAAYNASIILMDTISERFSFELDKQNVFSNKDNYVIDVYPNSFLGSNGVKIGKQYVGQDDFEVIRPNFETNLSYIHYVDKEPTIEKDGDFYTAFINDELLKDDNYKNKYNVFLYGGYNEVKIVNHNSENNLKALLVTHSYGRTLAPYLSLYFSETRYLDPQKGRFEDSILEYVKEYQPDIVLFMYNDEFVN